MTTRPSRAHWRVQTQSESGAWQTRCWSELLTGAIVAAEGYAGDLDVEARVVLGEVVYYTTRPAADWKETRCAAVR